MLMRFKDSPEPRQPGMVPPGAGDKVMHSSFRIGDRTDIQHTKGADHE
jgi:PhnB protein